MAAANLGINITISGSDSSAGPMKSARKNLGRLEKKTANYGAAATRIFAGVTASIGVMKGVMSITEESRAFEFELAKIGGLMGKTVSQLGDVSDAAEKASLESTFSPTEAILGMKNLITMGFTSADAIATLTPALQLAEAAGIGVATSTSTVGSALKIFNMDASKATEVTGKLFAAQGRSAIAADQMQIALANVAGGAGAAQQGIDSALVSIGLLKNTGVEASVAGSQVGIAMSNIAKNSKNFDKLGISLLNGNGQIKQLPGLVLEVSKALDKNFNDPIKRAQAVAGLFGERGKKAFIGIEKQLTGGKMKDIEGNFVSGQAAIDDFTASLVGGEKQLAFAATQVRATLKGQLDLLQGSVGLAAKGIGDEMGKVLKPMVTNTIQRLNAFIEWFRALPVETKASIGRMVVAFAGIVAVGGMVLALGSAFTLLGVAAFPVIAIIATIGFGVAALAGDSDELSGSFDKLGAFADKVAGQFRAFWEGLKQGASSVMPEVVKAMGGLVAELGKFSGDTASATTTGKSFGKTLGKVAVAGVKLATAAVMIVNGLRPFADAAVRVVGHLGGLETVLGAIQIAMVFIAANAVGNMVAGFASVGIAALTASGGVGTLAGSLVAMVVSGKISAGLAVITGGMKAMRLAVLTTVTPVMAMAAAFTAVVVAVDQLMKLLDEIKEFGSDNFLNEIQRDLGVITQAEYEKRFAETNFKPKEAFANVPTPGQRATKDFRVVPQTPFQMVPDAGMGGGDADSAAAKLKQLVDNTSGNQAPTAAPAGVAPTGGGKQQMVTIDPGSIAAIGAAAAKAPAPITNATITMDGQVVADLVAQHTSGAANDGSVPAGPVVR